jgi:hypothetical protein
MSLLGSTTEAGGKGICRMRFSALITSLAKLRRQRLNRGKPPTSEAESFLGPFSKLIEHLEESSTMVQVSPASY